MDCLESPDNFISQLPTELLMNIFEYIPNRCNLSLVCLKFYEIICKIEQNIYQISIKDQDPVRKSL